MRDGARRRRPGVRRRRQPQRRSVGLATAGQVRRRREPPQLAQDVLHPARRRRPRRGPGRVRAHLAPFLPGDPLGGADQPVGPVSAARCGSAGILPIPWVYIRMMGADGLRRAHRDGDPGRQLRGQPARRWRFPVLYTGANGRVAHECIIDLRPITRETGVTVDDVAKRLIDFGFHAPTMSFPVAGTLMIEPTESEDLGELDRFCEAMLAIRAEIDRVASGRCAVDVSPLRHAPHTAEDLIGEWDRRTAGRRRPFPIARLRATSTSRRCRASTAPTVTATSSAPASRSRSYARSRSTDVRARGAVTVGDRIRAVPDRGGSSGSGGSGVAARRSDCCSLRPEQWIGCRADDDARSQLPVTTSSAVPTTGDPCAPTLASARPRARLVPPSTHRPLACRARSTVARSTDSTIDADDPAVVARPIPEASRRRPATDRRSLPRRGRPALVPPRPAISAPTSVRTSAAAGRSTRSSRNGSDR